jgi:plasmid maintenance system antidote protein VapI
MTTVPFQIPGYHQSISLARARNDLPPELFRYRLRRHLLDHPDLTLAQVAKQLNLTRQRISIMVGKLNRPTCATTNRPSPGLDQARQKLLELELRVLAGESASSAAHQLGISINQVYKSGFRTRDIRSPHGSQARLTAGCRCWRCRQAAGLTLSRGPRTGPIRKAAVLDWSAWVDPDDKGRVLTQVEIARLVDVGRGAVSRIIRAANNGN